MKHLEYKCECLEGNYLLAVDGLSYRVVTDIERLESREGELGAEDAKKFAELLAKAGVEKWDEEYTGENGIEDAVRWQFSCEDDNAAYHSQGEESFYPYGYEYLLEALELCDPGITYFK